MKAKPPFQVLVLDDNGRQLFEGYVSIVPEPHQSTPDDLLNDLKRAITNPKVSRDTAQWITL